MNLSTAQASNQKRIVLRAEGVWKSYDDGTIAVLKGVDFEVAEGETVALCGPSGCGKSTLLHLFGGLDSLDRGAYRSTVLRSIATAIFCVFCATRWASSFSSTT